MHDPLNVRLINKSCVLKSLLLKTYVVRKKDIRFRNIYVEADKQTTV